MKCPFCAKRKLKVQPDLKTLRTLKNGATVKRERVCPKCKLRADTVELFRKDYDLEKQAAVDELTRYQDKAEKAEDVLEEVRAASALFARLGRAAGA